MVDGGNMSTVADAVEQAPFGHAPHAVGLCTPDMVNDDRLGGKSRKAFVRLSTGNVRSASMQPVADDCLRPSLSA